MNSLSIIVPVYNSPKETEEMLRSLNTIPIEYELIIIDDCSNDETRKMLLDYAQKNAGTKLILNDQNLGFAESCNRAANAASQPILAFLNNDLILLSGWFEPMWELIHTMETPGIIGNIQRNANSGLIDHAGMFFHWDGIPRQARKGNKKPPRSVWSEWKSVCAACIMIPRDVFLQFGGFDTRYKNGCEDSDLCVRMAQKGYRHYVSNKSEILHHVSLSPRRHIHDDTNIKTFLNRWENTTRNWGKREWLFEFWCRYAKHFWRIDLASWIRMPAAIFRTTLSWLNRKP